MTDSRSKKNICILYLALERRILEWNKSKYCLERGWHPQSEDNKDKYEIIIKLFNGLSRDLGHHSIYT